MKTNGKIKISFSQIQLGYKDSKKITSKTLQNKQFKLKFKIKIFHCRYFVLNKVID